MAEKVSQSATGLALAQHGDDRVVARHRARDARKGGLVDAASHHVRGPGRGSDHRHGLDQLDRQDQLPNQPRVAAVALARPDQSELMDVSRDRGLGDAQAAPRQGGGDVLLRVSHATADEIQDRLLALVLGANRGPAHRTASLRMAWARSISAAVMISGGTNRTVWSSTALTTRPASRHACWSGLARGSANSMACIRPLPRTSLAPRVCKAAWRISPISAACPTSPSRSTTSRTASAAAQASGLPPKVEP